MKARLAVIAAGLALLAGGVTVVDAPAGTVTWPDVRWLEPYLTNPLETLAGLALAMGGAVLIVAATRPPKAELPGPIGDPVVPREAETTVAAEPRRLVWMFAGVCAVTLAIRLATARFLLIDLALFAATLVLAALGVRSLDPRRRRPTGIRGLDVAIAAGLAAAAVTLHSIGSDHWLFTSIGDEMPFFEKAREIADGREWNAFDVVGGVYDTHSFLDSAYQAAVMMALGRMDVVGWRASLALLMGGAAAGIYLAGVVLRGRTMGLAAAAVLASSHYLMAFSHIGYNNPHAVFVNVLAALALAVAWRTGRWHHHWLAGAALGLSLYTFLAGLAFWVVAAVVIGSEILHRRSTGQRRGVLVMILGFAATVAPALYVTTITRLTDVVSRNSVILIGTHHGSTHSVRSENLLRSVLALWSDEQITGHHLGGALLDRVTGALLVLGVVVALSRLGGFAERLALGWLTLGLALIAVSHYEGTPSTSRLLTLIPPMALLCGLAVSRLVEPLSGRAVGVTGAGLGVVLWLVLPWLNLHQLFVASPARAMAASRVVMVMKALQEHSARPIVDVGLEPDGTIESTLTAYPWMQGRYRFVAHPDLTAEALQERVAEGAVLFVDRAWPHIADDLRSRLPADVVQVEDRDPTGQYVTVLFRSPGS